MNKTPSLRVTLFAQLKPGELFIAHHNQCSCVGLAAHDGMGEGQMLALLLGHSLPNYLSYPSIVDTTQITVISFGSEFMVRLPTSPDDWQVEPPPAEVLCLVVTETAVFIRCNFSPMPDQFRPCFVDLSTGEICISGAGPRAAYCAPPGINAYATRWTLVTTETPDRTVFMYPAGS